MKKSIISVILSLAMLVSMCAPSFAAVTIEEATYDQTVSFMGFDDYTGSDYGVLVKASNESGYSPYTLTKGIGPNGENDTALSVTTTKGGKLHIYYADESVTSSSFKSTLSADHVKFSYDFYADLTNKSATTGTTPIRFMRSYLGMKTTSSTEQLKITPQFFWSSDEEKLSLRIGDSDTGRYYIPDNKWYTIEHTYDFSNIKNSKIGIHIEVIDKEINSAVAVIDRPEFAEKGGSDYTNAIEYVYFDTASGSNDFYGANFIFDNFRFEKLDDTFRIVDFPKTIFDVKDSLSLTACIPDGFRFASVYVGSINVADITEQNTTGFYKVTVPVKDFSSKINFDEEYDVSIKLTDGAGSESTITHTDKITVTSSVPYAKAYKYNTSVTSVNKLIPYSASNLVIDLGGNKLNNEDITNEKITLAIDGASVGTDKYTVSYSDGSLVITPDRALLKANSLLDVEISSDVQFADTTDTIGENVIFSLYVGDDNLLYVESSVSATVSNIATNIKVVNSGNAEAKITVITAGYNLSELIDVIEPQEITISAQSVKEQPVSLDMTSSYAYAKVFVLENMTSLKPLIAEKTASVTE